MTNEGKQFRTTEVYQLHYFISALDYVAEQILNEELEIKYTEFLLLMHIDISGPSTQEALVNLSGYSKSAISKRVESLVQKGLYSRTQNPTNRRQNIIQLTKKGIEVLKQAYTLLTNASEKYFTLLDKRLTFKEQVQTLYERIQKNDMCD